jgi:hypothetical protein
MAWGQSDLNASQILRPPVDEDEKSALAEAKEFLLDELKDGPMGAKQVKKNSRGADIAERTLRRAKAELRVKSDKEADGSWTWSLPTKEAKGGQPPTVGPVGTLGTLGTVGPLEGENSAFLSEEGQGGQGCHELKCKHGFSGGTGCYMCDPGHPYRLKGESTA